METLQQISDGSLDDVYLSGVPLTTIYPTNVKEEPADDYDYMPIINDFDNDENISLKSGKKLKLESEDPDWNYEGELKPEENTRTSLNKRVNYFS